MRSDIEYKGEKERLFGSCQSCLAATNKQYHWKTKDRFFLSCCDEHAEDTVKNLEDCSHAWD